MANERLYQFPSKPSPVPADIVYVGDSADGFNEVQCTIAQIIAAYPLLAAYATMTFAANTFPYYDNSDVLTAGAISSFGVGFVGSANAAAGRTALGLGTMATESASSYLALAGGTMSGAINMGSQLINNLLDPVSAQDAATKAYVDSIAAGLNVLPAAYAATTANLNATYANGASGVGATLTNAGAMAAFSIDGVSPPLNSIILVKDQSTALQNGIYILTVVGSGAVNWVLTRATYYDSPSEINPGDFELINFGTVNTGTGWVQTATVTTVGVDAINFSLFGSGIYALKGANADITSMTGLTGVLQAPTAIQSAAGLPVLSFVYTASAVNHVEMLNNTTGSNPAIYAVGTDGNITLQLNGKGTGGVDIYGVTTNSAPTTGIVGEIVSASRVSGSASSLTTNVPLDVVSISLGAGDWDLWGNALITSGTQTVSVCGAWISTTSATVPDLSLTGLLQLTAPALLVYGSPTPPPTRLLLSGTTTVYLTAFATFASGSATACGNLYARRRR